MRPETPWSTEPSETQPTVDDTAPDFAPWSAPAGEVLILPVGLWRRARLRLQVPNDAADVGDGSVSIGVTVEASASLERSVRLDLDAGTVSVDGFADEPRTTVNSSVDRFVSSLAVFETWHQRILACEFRGAPVDSTVATGVEHLVALDPALGTEAWWPGKLRLVARLI